MGWETRGGSGRYYTRSRRVGTRIVRECLGSGERAERAAQDDEQRRLQREKARSDEQAGREAHSALNEQVQDFCQSVQQVVSEVLRVSGYHQHARGEWRKTRLAPNTDLSVFSQADLSRLSHSERTAGMKTQGITEEGKTTVGADALPELIRRAEAGDRSVQNELRQMLAIHAPQGLMPAATRVRTMLLFHLCGKDILQMADLQQQIQAMTQSLLEQTLTGVPPTVLERLLIERVVTCWLYVHVAEMTDAHNRGQRTARQAEASQKRIEGAERRYLSAIKTLAQIRRLQLPSLQLNIADKQINIADKQINIGEGQISGGILPSSS